MKILCIIGTRPEAIKMAPLITLMKQDERFECVVCITSQHMEMLGSTLNHLGITTDYDLEIMQPNQNLFDITVNILRKIETIITETTPDIILVQGDTTTTFIAALSGYYTKTKIGHIEAGLRTHDKYAPYPEEINRQMVSCTADIHFAPTTGAKQNLMLENIPESKIFVTGNTVIDALILALEKINSAGNPESSNIISGLSEEIWSCLNDANKKLILVTAHRRENHSHGLHSVCQALKKIAKRDDVFIVFPVHLNPNVRKLIEAELANTKNIFLVQPLDYLTFIFLMNACHFIITDSGGIQEEAPFVGKPVLVTRALTERPESVAAGTVKVVGCDPLEIISQASKILDNKEEYQKMARCTSFYGDGKSSERILDILANHSF